MGTPANEIVCSRCGWHNDAGARKCGSRGRPRTFAWLLHNRRLVVDYERRAQTSEALIEVAMIRLLIARLVQGG